MSKKAVLLSWLIVLILTLVLMSYLTVSIFLDQGELYPLLFMYRSSQLMGAVLIGAGLAISGVVLQTYLGNDLASPQLIGITSFAGLAAAITIVFGLGAILQYISSLIVVTIIVLALLLLINKFAKNSIILFGILINFLSETALMLIKYFFANLEDYAQIDFWFWGSLEKISDENRFLFIFIILGIALLLGQWRNLDLMSQGITHVEAISSDSSRLKSGVILMFASIAVIVSVSTILAGKIGFIGLMVPHLTKAIFRGFGHRVLLWFSALIGANILTLCLLIIIILKNLEIGKLPIGLVIAIPGLIAFVPIVLKRLSSRNAYS